MATFEIAVESLPPTTPQFEAVCDVGTAVCVVGSYRNDKSRFGDYNELMLLALPVIVVLLCLRRMYEMFSGSPGHD